MWNKPGTPGSTWRRGGKRGKGGGCALATRGNHGRQTTAKHELAWSGWKAGEHNGKGTVGTQSSPVTPVPPEAAEANAAKGGVAVARRERVKDNTSVKEA